MGGKRNGSRGGSRPSLAKKGGFATPEVRRSPENKRGKMLSAMRNRGAPLSGLGLKIPIRGGKLEENLTKKIDDIQDPKLENPQSCHFDSESLGRSNSILFPNGCASVPAPSLATARLPVAASQWPRGSSAFRILPPCDCCGGGGGGRGKPLTSPSARFLNYKF